MEERQISEASETSEPQADGSAAETSEEDGQGEADRIILPDDLERIGEGQTTKSRLLTKETAHLTTEGESTDAVVKVDKTDGEEAGQDEELIEDALDLKLALPKDDEPVRNLIKDDALRAEVLKIVNAKHTGDPYTDENFEYKALREYEGDFDFTGMSNPEEVADITGLGGAKNATSIDISKFTKVTKIPDGEFAECEFTKIELPSSVTEIGKKAFAECKKLNQITLPANLSVLDEQVFSGCAQLKQINAGTEADTLPKSLTRLGQQVFADTALEQITIPSFTNDTEGAILQNAPSLFIRCYKLKQVTIGKKIKTIPMGAFQEAGKDVDDGLQIIFENDSELDKILESAFQEARLSKTLDLSMCTNLTSIADSAFMEARFDAVKQPGETITEYLGGLETLILPDKTVGTKLLLGNNVFAKTHIGAIYVKGASETDEVFLPEYISEIGTGCFYGNDAMKKVSLPSGLTEIPDYTFDGCEKLAEVEQRQTDGKCQVKAIGDCAFRSTAIQNTDFMMKMDQLETIGYEKVEDIETFTYPDGGEITSLPTGGNGSISIDENTKEKLYDGKPVGSEVFTDCQELTSVQIPASVKSIGVRAFILHWNMMVKMKNMSKIQKLRRWNGVLWMEPRAVWNGIYT